MEQFPAVQHEPVHGLGEHEAPPMNVPPTLEHWAGERRVQVVPVQHDPVLGAQGLGEHGPSKNSPPALSQDASVRIVHDVPIQHAPF
jgi:hypothetical protein